jgi:hypothetical protein
VIKNLRRALAAFVVGGAGVLLAAGAYTEARHAPDQP